MSNCFTQVCAAALFALSLMVSSSAPGSAESLKPAVSASGVIAAKSAYGMEETVERLKKDVAAKGITFFQEIDQAALAAKAGIALRPSILLIFGNPPLGTQFITANPQAGLDWPVRTPGLSRQVGRRLDGLHGLRLDRQASWRAKPRRAISHGFGSCGFDRI